MEKPFMEVIRFDNSDVIATSGGLAEHTVTGGILTCGNGHGDAEHFMVTGSGYEELLGENVAAGMSYFPQETGGYGNKPYSYFKDSNDISVGIWYYENESTGYKFVRCTKQ